MAHSKTTWQPGQSGNRSGKPKGAPDKRTALRELLLPHAPALVEKALELALRGDTTALKLCIDRLMPPLRAKEEPVTFALEANAPLACICSINCPALRSALTRISATFHW